MCFVESTQIDNLIPEMMLGHLEGNIIQMIKQCILSLNFAPQKTQDLCTNNDDQCISEERQVLLTQTMDRYANMRGIYFVKYLSGTWDAGAMDVHIASLENCTKVLSTAVC